MKVAYLLHRFPYLTETFIVREMTELRRQGVDIAIFSLLRSNQPIVSQASRQLMPLTRYSAFLSLTILRSQLHFLRRRPRRYITALLDLLRQTWREPRVMARAVLLFPMSVDIARQAEALGIDHVHANFVWLEALAAQVVQHLTHIPFSIRPHAFGLFSRDQRDVREQLRRAAHIVTVSEYHRAYSADLTATDPRDVSVVHYGVDTSQYHPVTRPRRQPVRILSIGRGVEKKGHKYLLEACGELRARGVHFVCELLVGGDAERRDLQALADHAGVGHHVSFLEPRGEEQMVDLHHRADIFTLACVVARNGDRDGLPNVLIEAMACGLPVVTTPVAGIPDLVVDGENGFLVPERDSVRLADALERLIGDHQLRTALGASGRASVLSAFDIRDTAHQLRRVFARHLRTDPTAGGRVERAKGAV